MPGTSPRYAAGSQGASWSGNWTGHRWATPDTACAGQRGLPSGHALPWVWQAGRAEAL